MSRISHYYLFYFMFFLIGEILNVPLSIHAQQEGNNPLYDPIITEKVQAFFVEQYQTDQKRFSNPERFLIRKGILADRKEKFVKILAVFTGVQTTMPLEFVLVGVNGKDYESIAVTLAKPSEIREAMEFIGIPVGEPISGEKFLFWARGERVVISATWEHSGKNYQIPIHELAWQPKKNRLFPIQQWIFTGSFYATLENKKYLAADETGDIIAIFNSPWALFDIPIQAPQSVVYGDTIINERYPTPIRTPVWFTIQPAQKELSSLIDVELTVYTNPDAINQSLNPAEVFRFDLLLNRRGQEPLQKTNLTFQEFLQFLTPFAQNFCDIFLYFKVHPKITVKLLQELYQNLAVIFQQDILKAGYLKGEIYYQAFLPKPEWRNIKHRPIQPIELRIIQPPYTFSYQEEKINSQGDFVYEAFTRSFQTIQDLNEILRSRENWQTNTIFLYVSPETTYETILSWYQHLASRYPIIYLFIE